MNSDQFQRIRDVFHQVAILDPPRRLAALRQLCDGDEAVRAEVESLLSQDEAASSAADRLDRSSLAKGLLNTAFATLDRQPLTIGRYRIVRKIGEGGMGTVYEAEQENPRRSVALKLIRPGMASAALLRRFENEAHILARLQHPGIAQIFEAGRADDGGLPQPYFAMELVRGQPLAEYTRDHRPNLAAKVSLVALICDAVHHAHQKGVIHRDLKPANVLVTNELQIADCRLQIEGAATVRGKSAICNLQSPRSSTSAWPASWMAIGRRRLWIRTSANGLER